MQFICNTEDIFFDNYSGMVEKLGGYSKQLTPAVYSEWMEEWSPNKHHVILLALEAFIRSGDFRMDYRHYGHDLNVESAETK